MKKALRAALFVLLLSVVGMTKMYAYDFSAVCETGQTLYYNITDAVNHHVELTYPGTYDYFYSWSGFTKPTGNIILPESVQYEGNTYTVTSIGMSTFYDCWDLTGMKIPNTVVSIGDYAFYNCRNITGSLVIPDGVTRIPPYAFAHCSSLRSLVIPSSVVSIRSHAFYGCSHLVEVSLSGNSLVTIGVGAFAKCRRWRGDVVLPESVTEIHDGAFSECSRLTGIAMGASVAFIGSSAFSECSGLTEIEIPHSVTSIGECAFMGCSGLTSITIPNSVTNLGFTQNYGCRVFADCPSLEQITVEAGNPIYDSRDNCNAIIETETNQLLIGCKNTIIPVSVTSIGGHAFYGSGLTSITIPNSVTSIGESAFRFCTGLTTITIPSSVNTIESTVLGNCSALTSAEILSSPTSIPSYMFLSCGNLTAVAIPESVTKIESFAFSNCTSLTSIEIPSSVTTIQMCAFNNCSGLTSMTVWADNPPTMGPDIFDDVNKSIPVYVPCGSISAYQNAAGWNEFNNYMSATACNAGEITVIANPTEGGTVTGEGYYEGGATCTVTATANTGYYFLNWTENGTAVSCDTSYSFIVSGGRDLVANFAEGNMIVIGDGGTATNIYLPSYSYLQYSFAQQIYTADEIGIAGTINSIAFYNNGPEKTRTYDFYLVATDKKSFANTTDWVPVSNADKVFSGEVTMLHGWTTIVFDTNFEYDGSSNIILVADDNTGAYTFSPHMACRVFDTDGNQTIRVCSSYFNYNPSSPSSYNGTLMNVKNQIVLGIKPSAVETVEQTTALAPGWNWYSTYIEQEGIDGLGQLENSIGIPDAIIQSKADGYVKSRLRNGRVVWGGQLSTINNEEMYKVRTNEACTATMSGVPADPASHPITIIRGWNWIGFPCSQSVSVDVALLGYTPKNGDVIKGISSNATYSNGTWSGTLNTLEPGQGYMYGSKSNATKTLVFQSGRGEATLANITPENNYYQPVNDYSDNMTLTAIIELDGEELRSDNYELAAFAGDECRGSVKLMYVEPIDRYVAFLTVFGDKEEDLNFRLTDGIATSLSTDRLAYATDGILGELDNPVVLHFGPMDVEGNALVDVKIYPNPSAGIFNIEGQNIRKVEVFNVLGQPVYAKDTENGLIMIDLTNHAAGIYLIRVVTDNGIVNNQIMKR